MTGPDAEQDAFRRHATPVNVPGQLSSLGRISALASWPEHLARALLQEPLPRRGAHVQGVALRARSLVHYAIVPRTDVRICLLTELRWEFLQFRGRAES